MAYSPIAYTTSETVQRLLRVSNNKIRVGTDPGELSPTDLDGFILDASEYIDGFLRNVVGFNNLPVPNFSEKPEIRFAASRYSAYLVLEAMYSSYRRESLGSGTLGWKDEADKMLVELKKHIDEGVYTDLSPATGGIQFITTEQYFQTQIGVRSVDPTMRSDQLNTVPDKDGNIGPYNDGTELP